MKRDAIVREAREWIDTPFLHQGALKGVGCDCSGLVLGVMAALGDKRAEEFLSPKHRSYHFDPDAKELRDGLESCCEEVPFSDVAPGDVLLMRLRGEPKHVGFLSSREPDTLLHAYNSAHCVVEHSLGVPWRRRLVAAYRIRGVA